MSRYPEKSELPPLLVSRPEFRFPLDNIGERPWIEPFTWGVRGVADPFGPPGMAQCNRVQRPPPPPHLIAQSKKSHNQGASRSCSEEATLALNIDPAIRVRQLEKSLAFVKESHALVLSSLHKEVDELKNKNRELQFQLIVGVNSPETATAVNKSTEEEEQSTVDLQKKIDKLEKEIRRLRNALRESLQINTQLTSQLQSLKIKNKEVEDLPSTNREEFPARSHSALDLSSGDLRPSTPNSGSPKIDEYSDSLKMIQQAASTSARTKSSRPAMEIRRYDRQYNGGGGGGGGGGGANGRNHQDWGGQGGDRGRRYSDYQPRLPRLALRNQQNFQQGGDSLPILKKPLFPSLEHQSERTRKPRGQRARPQNNLQQR